MLQKRYYIKGPHAAADKIITYEQFFLNKKK